MKRLKSKARFSEWRREAVKNQCNPFPIVDAVFSALMRTIVIYLERLRQIRYAFSPTGEQHADYFLYSQTCM